MLSSGQQFKSSKVEPSTASSNKNVVFNKSTTSVSDEIQLLDLLFNKKYDDQPDVPLFIDLNEPSRIMSRSELKIQTQRFAAGLKRMGLQRGDVVAICSPGNIQYPMLFYASLTAGCVFVPMRHSTLSSPEEIANDLDTIRPKLVVLHPSETEALALSKKAEIPNILMFSTQEKTDLPLGIQTVDEVLLSSDEITEPYVYTKKEMESTPCCLYFTSGSTGRRKAVMITQSALIWFLLHYLSPNKSIFRYLTVTSFSFLSALPVYILLPLFSNISTFIISQNLASIHEICQAIEKHRIQSLFLPPYLAYCLGKEPGIAQKYDLSSIQSACVGGTMANQSMMHLVKENSGLTFVNIYGMTECFAMLKNNVQDTLAGSVGRLEVDHYIRIVDREGNDVDLGKEGELRVKGPTTTLGYYRNPEATAELFDEQGYLKTGDICKVDENGLFYHVTRLKDLIKYKSNHIYPIEIEKILITHPSISDCAVVGIYSKDEGTEHPRAYVTLVDHTTDNDKLLREIQEYTDSQLPDNKRLRGGVVELDKFPRTGSGKIQRFELRQWANK